MRRMYSENELYKAVHKYIEDNPSDVVQALVGKDISVNGITSKGIANTGGIANIGDVAISGDLIVQGEGKGNITANAIKQTAPTWEFDMPVNSSYLEGLGLTLTNKFYKLIQYGNILYLVCAIGVKNETESSITINWDSYLAQYDIALPNGIAEKIYDTNGKKVTEGGHAPICRTASFHGSSTASSGMYHNGANNIYIRGGGSNGLNAGASGSYDWRFFLVL